MLSDNENDSIKHLENSEFRDGHDPDSRLSHFRIHKNTFELEILFLYTKETMAGRLPAVVIDNGTGYAIIFLCSLNNEHKMHT